MEIQVKGSGKSLEVHLMITWRSLKAFLKAIMSIIITLVALLALPALPQLLVLLGR